jgi:hypothetical protein
VCDVASHGADAASHGADAASHGVYQALKGRLCPAVRRDGSASSLARSAIHLVAPATRR